MDPNLEKIRDANMDLIKEGRIAKPIIHAKHYLSVILGKENQKQAEIELEDFAQHIKEIAGRA
jgi:hypothetical protein